MVPCISTQQAANLEEVGLQFAVILYGKESNKMRIEGTKEAALFVCNDLDFQHRFVESINGKNR